MELLDLKYELLLANAHVMKHTLRLLHLFLHGSFSCALIFNLMVELLDRIATPQQEQIPLLLLATLYRLLASIG